MSVTRAPRRRTTLLVVAAFVVALSQSPMARAQAITEQDAHDIGVNAYLYFYSPITMDLTRKQLTNVEPGKGLGGPMNSFANVGAYPTADMRVVVRPTSTPSTRAVGWISRRSR